MNGLTFLMVGGAAGICGVDLVLVALVSLYWLNIYEKISHHLRL